MKFFLSILICISSGTLLYSNPVILDEQPLNKRIGLHLEYLIDNNKNLTIEDITSKTEPSGWIKSRKEAPGFGFSTAAYWIRFTVKNISNKTVAWHLEQEYPLIDYLHLYVPEKKDVYRLIQTGDQYPFSQRTIRYRTFVFPLKTEPNKTETYYLRFESSGSMTMSLRMLSPQIFQDIKETEMPFLWLFYGFLLVILLYNLIIFLYSRDTSYFFYSVYVAALLLQLMSINGIGPQYLWPNSIWWTNYSIPLLISILIMATAEFARLFIRVSEYSKSGNTILRIIFFSGITSGILTIIFSYFNNYRFCILSTTILAVTIVTIMFFLILYLGVIKKSRQASIWIIALGFYFIGAILFILKTYSILPESFVTTYSLYIGAALQAVLLSLGLADRLNIMSIELKKAQKKYKHLVESSDDIIFSLNEDLHFLSVNEAITKHLGYKREDIINVNILDFIQETFSKKYNIARQIAEEYISDLKHHKSSVKFRTQFKSRFTHEPKEFSVKLEYAELEGKIDILGKASLISDDIISGFLESENQTFCIGNYLSNAELMSQRLTRNLSNKIKPDDFNRLRIAIREILINAIEHGNLNLTFDEKSQAMMENNYFRFIEERQKDSRYCDRKIKIDYTLTEEKVYYIITDQGNGFDHKNLMETPAGIKDGNYLTHGRGIHMTKQIFDVIKYNDKGNQIILEKYFTERH